MKIVVGASSFAEGNAGISRLLHEKKIELVKNPYSRKMTQEEIIRHLQGADGLLAGLETLNEEIFRNCPDLKAIARIGIGMDNVDLEAAQKYGIKVSNTPDGPTQAVAEMTLTALLAIIHNIIWANQDIHNGVWKKRMGNSIRDLNILVIGYGHIGKKTADLFSSLGAKIMIYDKFNGKDSTCSLLEGIRQADVITIHASGKEEIISSALFEEMKDGVIILNSARGALVHEQALYEALQTNKVSAFWGDALWTEPYEGIIKSCDNAILTPHICTYTKSCRMLMEKQALDNLLGDLGYV